MQDENKMSKLSSVYCMVIGDTRDWGPRKYHQTPTLSSHPKITGFHQISKRIADVAADVSSSSHNENETNYSVKACGCRCSARCEVIVLYHMIHKHGTNVQIYWYRGIAPLL